MHKVLVTGGSSGIGKAICLQLAQMKMTVVNADITVTETQHNDIIYKHCDIRSGKEVDALFLWMKENTGLPDILIINAGKGIHEKLTEGDPEKWLDVIQVNLMGALRFVRAFVPPMQTQKQGKIIFISSLAADKNYCYGGIYSATKAALEMIARTLGAETDSSIGITIVRAGITDTDFFKNHPAKTANAIGQGNLQPDDIAAEIAHIITKRAGTHIEQITIMPQEQSFFNI